MSHFKNLCELLHFLRNDDDMICQVICQNMSSFFAGTAFRWAHRQNFEDDHRIISSAFFMPALVGMAASAME
jgi:hypothetical protein